MRLSNASRRHSSALAPLCSFVYDHFKHANKVFLEVIDQEKSKRKSGGLADKYNGSSGMQSRVTVWLTGPRKWPMVSRFEGFSTKLNSWEEEFVLVLAHELRHIDQFHTTVPADYERDAEGYAIKVLKAYRER